MSYLNCLASFIYSMIVKAGISRYTVFQHVTLITAVRCSTLNILSKIGKKQLGVGGRFKSSHTCPFPPPQWPCIFAIHKLKGLFTHLPPSLMKDSLEPQKWLLHDIERFHSFHSGQVITHLFAYCHIIFRCIVLYFIGKSESRIR